MTMDDVIKIGIAALVVSGVSMVVCLGVVLWTWYRIGKIDDAE